MEKSSPVRMLVVFPPWSGNHWVESLLGTLYGLQRVGGAKKPDTAGGLQDGWILHMHRRVAPGFCDAIEAVPAHIVTVAAQSP